MAGGRRTRRQGGQLGSRPTARSEAAPRAGRMRRGNPFRQAVAPPGEVSGNSVRVGALHTGRRERNALLSEPAGAVNTARRRPRDGASQIGRGASGSVPRAIPKSRGAAMCVDARGKTTDTAGAQRLQAHPDAPGHPRSARSCNVKQVVAARGGHPGARRECRTRRRLATRLSA